MAFNDETGHFSRHLSCGWGGRGETAKDIAKRLQQMACDLRLAEADLGPLWPAFSSRAIRISDPGPVDELPVEALAQLIDRRARFDPPKLPAPVGPMGFDLTLAELPTADRCWRLDPHLVAGRVGPESRNGCYLRPNVSFPLWCDPDRTSELLRILVRAWEPDWALAGASLLDPDPDPEHDSRVTWSFRPWLAWAKTGETIPYEFAPIGEPAVVRAEYGGELRIWP